MTAQSFEFECSRKERWHIVENTIAVPDEQEESQKMRPEVRTTDGIEMLRMGILPSAQFSQTQEMMSSPEVVQMLL